MLTRHNEVWRWTREPDPSWIRALRALSPRSAVHSFLWLAWEPGDQWIVDGIEQRAQRWIIYDVLPRELVDPVLLSELEGPNPRTLNRHDAVLGEMFTDTLITRQQWELYRATGGYARPFWIVQGEKGGHKYQFTQHETKLLKLADQPTTTPAIGDLAYAEPSRATFDAIRRYDRLRRLNGDVSQFKRQFGKDYPLAARDAEQSFRRQLVAWLTEQVSEDAELYGRGLAEHDVRRSDSNYGLLAETAEQQFIETGRVTA